MTRLEYLLNRIEKDQVDFVELDELLIIVESESYKSNNDFKLLKKLLYLINQRNLPIIEGEHIKDLAINRINSLLDFFGLGEKYKVFVG